MGNNKKYYKNNNNNNKNYYYKNKKYNNKKNNYMFNQTNLNKNKIENNVNNNLGDEIINNDYNIGDEFEFVPKKKEILQDNIQSNQNNNSISIDNNDIKEEVEIKKKPRKNLLIKTNFGYALGIIILLLAIVGTTYSYFNYTKDSRQADIASGDIYVRVVEDTVNLSNKLYPMTKEDARARTDNVVTFTVKGLNTSDKTIYYEIKLNYGESKSSPYLRFNDKDLVFDLIEVGQNNEETYRANAKSFSDIANGARIWVDTVDPNTTTEITKTYKLRMWLSDKVTIDDDNGTYPASTYRNYYASIKASVYGDFNEKEPPLDGRGKVLKAINNKINAETNSCNPIYEEDGIKYFSGTNDCVDMNYVWYSGKLWRITAIYPDGSMKMITEDALTSIYWGSSVEYDGSWVYQWLNEDFYDTLVNPNDIIIPNSIWNYSTDSNRTPVKPETLETQKNKIAPIGLLNAYEYYNSYRRATKTTGYLNIDYVWWLLTPYSSSEVRNDTYNLSFMELYLFANGVRPVINLKSGLEFTGSGTKDNPYKIVGDKENPTNGTLINSRSVGEYVKFDNDIYRIVSIDETSEITKLTRVDYLRDNGTVVTKNFASSAYFGKSTNTQEDTYWDYYLNNTWYNSISSVYKNMLADDTYYLGAYGDNKHYKITICKDTESALNSILTKNCTKYGSSDADKTFTGKVGLPRVGEMFSAQLGSGSSSSSGIFTITPYDYSGSVFRDVEPSGFLDYQHEYPSIQAVRPSITLKSGIKITGGSGYVGGDTNSPFEISE